MLQLSPVLLANLCVSYVMTSRNEDAETVLRRVEEAEERHSRNLEPVGVAAKENNSSHLCLINLVIGYVNESSSREAKNSFFHFSLSLLNNIQY